MPLAVWLRYLADRYAISVVASQSIEGRAVTLEARDAAISEVLAATARQLGVSITRTGNMFFLGEIRPEDRAVLVRKCYRLGGERLQQAIQSLMSENGRCSAEPDGLVCVADRVEVLEKVKQLLDGVEAATSPAWVIQLYMVNQQDVSTRESGVDIDHSIKLSQLIGNATGTSGLNGLIDAAIKAGLESGSLDIICRPLVVLGDGETASLHSGLTVPVPQKALDSNGNLATTNFTYIETGQKFDFQLREISGTSARLTLAAEQSEVQGYVEESPIVALSRLQTVAVIQSGGEYLLGEMRSDTDQRQKSGPLIASYRQSDKRHGQIQIWAKAYRISGQIEALSQKRPETGLGSTIEKERVQDGGMDGENACTGSVALPSGFGAAPAEVTR